MRGVPEDEFAGLMAGLGPVEAGPVVAVGVSGGSDSLALALLTDAWARRRGGRAVALTVDHRLRTGSTTEAERVAGWLSARGIEHHILTWNGDKPGTRVQEAAREARYALLTGWCREHGVLHLATAHNQEDQAETFLMRLTRGSGPVGLAATSAVVESAGVRVLRPLLGIPRERLRQTLRALGQEWIEDPSNRNPKFRRVHVRGWLPALAAAGCPADRLAALANGFAEKRLAEERAVAGLIAESCRLDPAGYADLDARSWVSVAANVGAAALARVILAVGGGSYAPRPEKTRKILDWLREREPGASATLGRCRFSRSGEGIVVCRESRGLPVPTMIFPGGQVDWDRRFRLEFEGPGSVQEVSSVLVLGALGREGWAEVVADRADLRNIRIPYGARLVLPAVRDSEGILEVPHLRFRRRGGGQYGLVVKAARFEPSNTLSGTGFCLARAVSSTISSGVVEAA